LKIRDSQIEFIRLNEVRIAGPHGKLPLFQQAAMVEKR
jgi:hypothetical protein